MTTRQTRTKWRKDLLVKAAVDAVAFAPYEVTRMAVGSSKPRGMFHRLRQAAGKSRLCDDTQRRSFILLKILEVVFELPPLNKMSSFVRQYMIYIRREFGSATEKPITTDLLAAEDSVVIPAPPHVFFSKVRGKAA